MIGTYALGYFLPTILKKGLGFSLAASFVLSGVRDTFAVIVSFTLSWLSDRVKKSESFVFVQATSSIVGLRCWRIRKHRLRGKGTHILGCPRLTRDRLAGAFLVQPAQTQSFHLHLPGKRTIAETARSDQSRARFKSCLEPQED